MGNGQTKEIPTQIVNKKKSFSFDVGQFNNFNLDKIKPINITQNHISSSLDLKTQNHQNTAMPPIMSRQSSSVLDNMKHKMTLKQQNAKLQKLNKNNDELRKQLIQINQKLAQQLKKKKIPSLMNQHNRKSTSKSQKSQQKDSKDKNKFKAIALKKQLDNAYNQVSNYKKQVESLKKNQSIDGNMKVSQFEDKVAFMDQQIITVQKSLTSIRDIVNKQRVAIGEFQSQLQGQDIEEKKRQITTLKERLRQLKQISRKKQKDQKLRHELLIQMQRKLRQVNGDYMPEIKNWAQQWAQNGKESRVINKSRIKNKPNQQKSTNLQPQFLYQPSNIQFEQIRKQLQSAKKNHQQYHRKIEIQMRNRKQAKQLRQRIEQKLSTLEKSLQNLHYKKDRYLQVIMQNLSQLNHPQINDTLVNVNKSDEGQRLSRVITKGEDLPNQREFNDKKIIKNFDTIVDNLKIITVNVWTNEHNHIIAIQFFYTDGNSFFVGSKSSQINVVSQKRTLQLQQGDQIDNVMGSFNPKSKLLELIVFESRKGKVLKVGSQSLNSNNFSVGLVRNERIALISGRCVFDGGSWRINKLDFLIKQ